MTNITDLPHDVFKVILPYVSKDNLMFFQETCVLFSDIVKDLNLDVEVPSRKLLFSQKKFLEWCCTGEKINTYPYVLLKNGIKFGDSEVLEWICHNSKFKIFLNSEHYEDVIQSRCNVLNKLNWLREKRCTYNSNLFSLLFDYDKTILLWLKLNLVWTRNQLYSLLKNSSQVIKDAYLVINSHTILKHTLCGIAAELDNQVLLEWAYSANCRLKYDCCSSAASNGNLDMLKWLRERNCPWNHTTITDASKNGHLDIVIWSKENGCDMSFWSCMEALNNNHIDIFKWLVDNNCEITNDVVKESIHFPEVCNWLMSHPNFLARFNSIYFRDKNYLKK